MKVSQQHSTTSSFSNMEERQKDFKWFGEGFDGFPKRLPDDCVEYAIHIINSPPAESTVRTRLRQIHQAANVLTKGLLKDFIWQRQNFNLELVQEDGKVVYGLARFMGLHSTSFFV